MSAPRALKATSLRDSLGKTVRLLTKQGIDVQFRGHRPYVATRGDKVLRLVLPELNDDAPQEVIDAIQGFLDHEVGHIFYTPFGKAEKFHKHNRVRASLCNIIEDIRLEKLMPRDLPGTKENLERMYDSVMPTYFGPSALKANEPGTSKNEAFSCVMVCAMRALAGQKAFQKFMDANNLWPHFMPLISRMPNLSRRLRDMETFKDVESLVTDVLEALAPPPKQEEKDDQQDTPSDQFTGIDPDAADNKDAGATDDAEEGEDKTSGAEDEKDSDDGEGHGDGEGTDDGSDEEAGDCSGGPDSDDDGDDSGAGDEAGDQESGDTDTDSDSDCGDGADQGDDEEDDGASSTPADSDLEGNPTSSGKDAKENRTLRDALALLEPTQRRALFLYKKRKQTVAQIAEDLSITEDETVDLLSHGRRRLRDLLNGGI